MQRKAFSMEAEEVKIALVEVKRRKYEGVTPAKEILESIEMS